MLNLIVKCFERATDFVMYNGFNSVKSKTKSYWYYQFCTFSCPPFRYYINIIIC